MTVTVRDDFNVALPTQRALQAAADMLLQKSNEKSPTLSGDMDATAQALATDSEAAVGYSSPYAVRQHENIRYEHPGGDEPKFLERALINNQTQLLDEMADEFRRLFR